MCGRYAIFGPTSHHPKEVPADLEIEIWGHKIPVDYNICPTDTAPIILTGGHGPHLTLARWGLLPHWVREPRRTKPYFNARADRLRHNKVFQSSLDRRCLVPMGGFYEWASSKQPYFIHASGCLYCGGLWRRWQQGNHYVDSFAIITTPPHPAIAPFHDRSPLIIAPSSHDAWLSAGREQALAMMVTYSGELKAYRVDPHYVNRPRTHRGVECVAPALSRLGCHKLSKPGQGN